MSLARRVECQPQLFFELDTPCAKVKSSQKSERWRTTKERVRTGPSREDTTWRAYSQPYVAPFEGYLSFWVAKRALAEPEHQDREHLQPQEEQGRKRTDLLNAVVAPTPKTMPLTV